MAQLAGQVSGAVFGWCFQVINVPFFVLTWMTMGRQRVVRALVAIIAVTCFSGGLSHGVDFSHLYGSIAAFIVGGLIGIGMVVILKQCGSLGGSEFAGALS